MPRPGPYTCSCGHEFLIPHHHHPCSRMRMRGVKSPEFHCPACGKPVDPSTQLVSKETAARLRKMNKAMLPLREAITGLFRPGPARTVHAEGPRGIKSDADRLTAEPPIFFEQATIEPYPMPSGAIFTMDSTPREQGNVFAELMADQFEDNDLVVVHHEVHFDDGSVIVKEDTVPFGRCSPLEE